MPVFSDGVPNEDPKPVVGQSISPVGRKRPDRLTETIYSDCYRMSYEIQVYVT